jgi:CRISPR/Cas system CSM-associated protein Csm3 (group 7 of RAMP superfamily)
MTRLRTDRVELKYTLTFTMPFHFGTGLRSGLLDRTIVRNQDGYVYVPASTIKGVWREKCEQIERSYTGRVELVDTPHDAKKALLGLGDKITMTTRIFGSQQHPGRLFFNDAHLTEEEKKEFDDKDAGDEGKGRRKYLQTTNYTQVRLERPSRTSVKGALYTSEFGVRNFIFEGSVNGWLECMEVADIGSPKPTCSLQLLLAGLCMMEKLGGNKSTGKGACTFKITELKLNDDDKPIKESDWQSWLEHLDLLELYEYEVKEEGL